MKRFTKMTFLTLILILVTGLAFAANDDQGNPNDPLTNPRANACYEGGAMAGKCDTEWAWTCGWYLIRWQANASFPVPDFCASLLPQQSPVSLSGCYKTTSADFAVVGAVNTSPNAFFYNSTDGTCSMGAIVEGTLVQASTLNDAQALCISLLTARGFSPAVIFSPQTVPVLGAGYWFCAYTVL